MDIFSWAIEWLFSTKQFPPRWECGTWDNFTGWVFIVASLFIFAAYYSIPIALVVILRKAKFLYSIPTVRPLLLMFSLFIFSCGTGHLLDTAMFYWPAYRVLALMNTITAIMSWATIFILVPRIGQFISMQDPRKVFELNEKLTDANKELERYQRFFDMTLDMCCIAKGDKFVNVNKSWEKTLGFPKDSLENNKWIDFVHQDDKERTKEVGDKLAAGHFQIENFENRYRTTSNEYRWLSWMAMNNPSDNSEYFCVARDVTDYKIAQESLQKAISELEQFSYVASHDLKAPLRAISNLATWLQEDCGDQLSDKGKDYLRLMVGRITRMNMLIEGLLQVSRVGRRNVELEEVDLNTLVADILDGLDKKDFTINVTPLPKVRANKISIGQVFSNLIVNAIKHHPRSDGVVNLTYQELPDCHQFAVCDDGDGIPKEFQSKLFVMFQTLKPKDDTNSTGIGLALCKKIIEYFGGTIKLESDRGKGAKFIFTIPK